MDLSGMPSANAPEHEVKNNGFYPNLDVAEFVDNYAIALQYGQNIDMLIQKLSIAIASVNKDLTIFHVTNWLGIDALTDVESDMVNDESVLVSLYKHAVFSLAKSMLLVSRLGENHRDKAAVQSLDAVDSEQHWLSQSRNAVSTIVNQSTSLSVALL